MWTSVRINIGVVKGKYLILVGKPKSNNCKRFPQQERHTRTQQAANRWAKELNIRNSNKLLLFHENAAIRIADLLPSSWTNAVFSLTRDLCWPLLRTVPFLFSRDNTQTSSLSCTQAAVIDAFDRGNSTNNRLCVHKAVLAGTPVDLRADPGLSATVLLTQVSSTEATKRTIASILIKQLWNVYALI